MRIEFVEEKRFETHLACSKSTRRSAGFRYVAEIRGWSAMFTAGREEERAWWWSAAAQGTAVVPPWFTGDASGGGGGFYVRKEERRSRGERESRVRERGGSGYCFRVSGPRASPPFVLVSFSLFFGSITSFN